MWQAGWHFTQWQHIARLILALSLLVSCLCSRFPSRSSAVFLFHVIFLLNFLFFSHFLYIFSFLLYPFMSLLCNYGGVSPLSLSLFPLFGYSPPLSLARNTCVEKFVPLQQLERIYSMSYFGCVCLHLSSPSTPLCWSCVYSVSPSYLDYPNI